MNWFISINLRDYSTRFKNWVAKTNKKNEKNDNKHIQTTILHLKKGKYLIAVLGLKYIKNKFIKKRFPQSHYIASIK